MRFLSIVLLVITLISCQRSEGDIEEKPKNFLDKNKMINILTELTVLESTYQLKYIQASRFSYLMQKDADSLFQVFKTDSKTFDENMIYYNSNPGELAEMYAEVKKKLEQRKAKLPKTNELDVDNSIENNNDTTLVNQ